jgi:hypothetical protein
MATRQGAAEHLLISNYSALDVYRSSGLKSFGGGGGRYFALVSRADAA